MDADANISCEVVICGGGIAGLWLLDELRSRQVRTLLVETGRLGEGQTSSAQGILHGGMRYALAGIVSASASAVSDMAEVWRSSLAGTQQPDLSAIRYRARWCYFWHNDSWQSRLGMLGAKAALKVRPVPLADELRPPPLAHCPGKVYRLDEPVIDTASLLGIFRERNKSLLLQAAGDQSLEFRSGNSSAATEMLLAESNGRRLRIEARQLVLAAGAGNEGLRQQLGLPAGAMQRRPLHTPLVRGDLPQLNGHCVDGAHTRVTFSSDVDAAGRTVWQLGGQVTEDGVRMQPAELIAHARRELQAVLPGWQLPPVEWTTMRIDRAEGRTPEGSRPDSVQLLAEGNVLTAWPTKLVLAPYLADRILEKLDSTGGGDYAAFVHTLEQLSWPAPDVALLPWERELTWTRDA